MSSFIQRFSLELRQTATLAAPVAIGQLSVILMQVTDIAMVGHYSSRDLGGMALGNALYSTCLVVAFGILSAVSPLVSHAEGAGDHPAAGRALGQGLWASLFLAALMGSAMQFVRPVLEAMGQAPALAEVAQSFVRPLSVAYPAILAFFALRQFVEGLSLTRPTMYISITGLGVNAFLDWGLIYGHFGMAPLGAAGSGMATGLTQVINLAALATFVARSERFRGYHAGDFRRGPRWSELKHLLALGVPTGVSHGVEVGAFALTSILMGWFGPKSIAAHQIALNICSATFMIPMGISIAGAVRVGQARGRGDESGVRWAGWMTVVLAISSMCLSALVLLSVPRLLFSIYTSDAIVIEQGLVLLAVGAAFQIFDGVQVAGTGILRGLKDTRGPMVANILAYWGISIPTGYWLSMKGGWGPSGLWWGLTVGLALAAASHMLRFHYLVRHGGVNSSLPVSPAHRGSNERSPM